MHCENRDACFTVHKDDKADTHSSISMQAYYYTYYYPHRLGDTVVNEARFDEGFRECSF